MVEFLFLLSILPIIAVIGIPVAIIFGVGPFCRHKFLRHPNGTIKGNCVKCGDFYSMYG